jgi:hypothetical protein
MATVIITKDLRERVAAKINAMRNAELKADCPQHGTTLNIDISEMFNKLAWEGQEHLINVIPNKWLKKTNDAFLTLCVTVDDGGAVSHRITVNGLSNAWCKPNPEYYGSNDRISLSETTLLEFADETPGKAELLERMQLVKQVHEIDKRWQKVAADVDSFLKKCKSLNEGVKLFPNIRAYIGAKDLERLDVKPPPKAERQDIVAGLDTEALTASAMAFKLMGQKI